MILGILSVTLGVIGIFLFGFICGPIALILSAIGIGRTYKEKGQPFILNVVGLGLSIAACVTSPILWILVSIPFIANSPEAQQKIEEMKGIVTSVTGAADKLNTAIETGTIKIETGAHPVGEVLDITTSLQPGNELEKAVLVDIKNKSGLPLADLQVAISLENPGWWKIAPNQLASPTMPLMTDRPDLRDRIVAVIPIGDLAPGGHFNQVFNFHPWEQGRFDMTIIVYPAMPDNAQPIAIKTIVGF